MIIRHSVRSVLNLVASVRYLYFFFFSSRRRHTRLQGDWSSDVCSSDLAHAVLGAGTYAKNGVCAVSATGHGEYFIRAVAAHHVCAAVEYRGLDLQQAVREVLHEILGGLGGDGGLIAVGGDGQIVMDFSTEGMFRGARDSGGRREIAI